MRPIAEQEFSSILPATYLDLSNDLRAITLEILNNTIHYTRSSEFMSNNGMVVFAKRIAKDLGRPYIPRSDWWIEIPLKKYLDPVHAPLRLVAVKTSLGAQRLPDVPHIGVRENTLYATYRCYTDEGRQLLQQWFVRTQEDPDMRKALKLPPK